MTYVSTSGRSMMIQKLKSQLSLIYTEGVECTLSLGSGESFSWGWGWIRQLLSEVTGAWRSRAHRVEMNLFHLPFETSYSSYTLLTIKTLLRLSLLSFSSHPVSVSACTFVECPQCCSSLTPFSHSLALAASSSVMSSVAMSSLPCH